MIEEIFSSDSSYRTTGFESVDRYVNPSGLVEYLNIVNSLPAIKSCKEKTLMLLEPKSSDLVLDVGCGIGSDIVSMLDKFDQSIRFVGIDNSQVMIKQARRILEPSRNSGRVFLSRQDVNYLAFRDETFDVVRADRLFQHLEDPQKALQEILRVTKSGGRVVISDTYWGNLHVDGISTNASEAIRKTYVKIVRNPLIIRRVKGMLHDLGLNDSDIFELRDRIGFEGFRDSEAVLWMEDSLTEGVKMGVISEEERIGSVDSIRRTPQSNIVTSVDFQFIVVTKPKEY